MLYLCFDTFIRKTFYSSFSPFPFSLAFLNHDLLLRARGSSLKIPEYRVLNKIAYVCHSARCQLLLTQPDYARISLLRTGSRCECEIAEDCSANAHSVHAEPKVAFSRGCDDVRRQWQRSCCDTSGVRSYIIRLGVKREKHIPRGRKRETRSLRCAILEQRRHFFLRLVKKI